MNEPAQVLVLDPEEKAKNTLGDESSLAESKANSIVIDSDASYQEASDLVRDIKTLLKKVKDYWEPVRISAKSAYDGVLAKKKEMTDPLENAESILKAKMSDWAREVQRRKEEQEKRLKELALKELEEKLAEAADKETSGDKTGSEDAYSEAEVMSDILDAGLSTVESKPKAEGVSVGKKWVIKSIDASKVPIDINGAVIRPVDEKAVLALIKASKGTISIPGVVFGEDVSISVRSK